MSSSNKFDSKPSSPDFLASIQPTSLKPLLPPQAPTFPTLFELANSQEEQQLQKQKKQPAGLFESLLQSNPHVLFNDLLAHPKKYEPGVQQLLQLLISGRDAQSLDPQDQELPVGAMLTGQWVWLDGTTGANNTVLVGRFHGNGIHPCPALDMVSPDDTISAYLYRFDKSSIDDVNKPASGDESGMLFSVLLTCEAL